MLEYTVISCTAGKSNTTMKIPDFYDIYCNTFQLAIKLANYVVNYRMPEYIFGKGSLDRLPQLLKDKEAGKVLFVTDPGLVKLGMAKRVEDSMRKGGVEFVTFSSVEQNPTSDNVEEGFRIFRENGCNSIVALGGGSPMDCSKGICAKAAHPRRKISQMQGLLRVHWKVPKLFAIPTMAGTGSETTFAAVITDSKTRHKAPINDFVLIPRYAVLDPEMTVGIPPALTAATGMDALSHAVESYTNHKYNTRFEDLLAINAVRLIYDNLYKAYLDGSDITARENLQIAALYAGRAFTRGGVGYVHAIGHTLGGLYGVHHGKAMAILLPHVMSAFGPAAHKRLAELANACGIKGSSDAEKAEAFISWIEDMKRKMDIPEYLDMIKDKDVDQIIRWAMKEANPLYPTPVLWRYDDFRDFIESVRV